MEELAAIKVKGVPARAYRSGAGMTVVHIASKGPLVEGFLAIPTEARDNKGLPHTLEHLIFLGSKTFPFKGLLDMMANRCFSDGTNAWTDVDHTCYTLTTAGQDGFLSLLPIYLDHILNPTLTEHGFVTEVYHKTHEGRDGGVVYCEMEARNNDQDDLIDNALRQLLYPGKDCGYNKETGGLCADIRTLTNEEVRNYHKLYYNPKNLLLIVSGTVDTEALLSSVRSFEERSGLLSGGKAHGGALKPWSSAVPCLQANKIRRVEFPSEETEFGQFVLAWAGPPFEDFLTRTAIDVLLTYLTKSAISPLQAALVESEDPVASAVWYDTYSFKRTSMMLHFSGVSVAEHLSSMGEMVLKLLSKSLKDASSIDMNHMKRVLKNYRSTELLNREMNPGGSVSKCMIDAFINSRHLFSSSEAAASAAENLQHLETLGGWKSEQWSALAKRWILDAKCVHVIATPSRVRAKEIQSLKSERLKKEAPADEKEANERENTISAAVKACAKPPRRSEIERIQVPSVKSIKMHKVSTTTNVPGSLWSKADGKIPGLEQKDIHSLPFSNIICNIQSKFVDIASIADVGTIPVPLRKYIPLLCELLCKSSIEVDGKILSHEVMIKGLDADTQSNSCGLGLDFGRFFSGGFCDAVSVMVRVEAKDFSKAVLWMDRLLRSVHFTPSRLRSVCTQLCTDIMEYKDDPSDVMNIVHESQILKRDCPSRLYNFILQHQFLSNLLKDLQDSSSMEARNVIDNMETLYKRLFHPSNIVMHTSLDAERLQGSELIRYWSTALDNRFAKFRRKRLSVLKTKKQYTKSHEHRKRARCAIINMESNESGYLRLTVPLPPGFSSKHEDYAALRILIQLLVASEGPMWRSIRGKGLAYGYSIYVSRTQGLLVFTLSRCNNVYAAYNEAKKIVLGFDLNDKDTHRENKRDLAQLPLDVDAAKSSLILTDVVEPLSNPIYAAFDVVNAIYHDLPQDYVQDNLRRLQGVKREDLKRAKKYLTPLFEKDNVERTLTVVTHRFDGKKVESKNAFSAQENYDIDEHDFGSTNLNKILTMDNNATEDRPFIFGGLWGRTLLGVAAVSVFMVAAALMRNAVIRRRTRK